jgi:hypothetical protein
MAPVQSFDEFYERAEALFRAAPLRVRCPLPSSTWLPRRPSRVRAPPPLAGGPESSAARAPRERITFTCSYAPLTTRSLPSTGRSPSWMIRRPGSVRA